MPQAPSIPASQPVVPGRLTAHDVQLDLAPNRFGWLKETAVAADAAALRRRMEGDGYVFLRQFWPRSEVQAVRDSLTRQLERLGFLLPDTPPDEARARPGVEVGRAMEIGRASDDGPRHFATAVLGSGSSRPREEKDRQRREDEEHGLQVATHGMDSWQVART